MSKKLLKYDIIGFIFVSIIGTLAHFVYELTNKSVIAALFCPINESPWEHLKLIFFPYLIWTVIQAVIMKGTKKSFACQIYRCICRNGSHAFIFLHLHGNNGQKYRLAQYSFIFYWRIYRIFD